MHVELSAYVLFALTFRIRVAEKILFNEAQSSTLFIYGVLNIPTLYLDNIKGYGALQLCI